jgi:hypothetical protein
MKHGPKLDLPSNFLVLVVKTDGRWNEYVFNVHDQRWKEVLKELRNSKDGKYEIKIVYR